MTTSAESRCYKHRSLIRIVGMLIAPVINQWFTTSLLSTTVIFDTSQIPICLCPHIPCIPKSFCSHLFCVNIRALVSASITCCQIRMTGHYSCQIRIVGMLITPVINQWFTMLLSTTVIFDTSQMPICLRPHTFLTFHSNWSRDRIHPINALDSSCKPHVTRAYQSVVW